ncbi:MAG: tetratricopeptide repeat protein [Fimbriimonadales bacterium]|nr:tetratricopeptide repeat protein [Fimbriimonadales bacterium]
MNLGSELDPKREEIERLLRLAHIHQVRGERSKAKELLQQALELDTESAGVWELLGDYQREAGDWQGAHDAYKKAHELDPTNAPIERKYAEAVLQLTRQQEQYQQWERALEGKGIGEGIALPRNPGLAFLLSLLMPGVGQLYNGQFVKGGIILGIMVLGVIVFLATPGGSDFIYNLLAYLVNPARARGALSGLQLFTGLIMLLAWVYAFIDAPLSAAAQNRMI